MSAAREKAPCQREGCPLQGQVHPKCRGHTKRRDCAPCRREPVVGAHVCRYHGGGAPQVQAAGQTRVVEAEARRQLGILGVEGEEVDPARALLDLISWKYAEVRALREHVAAIEPGDVVWGATTEQTVGSGQFPGTDVTEEAVVAVWVRLLHEAENQLATFAAAAHRAGIAERQVRIAEQQGRAVAAVIRRVLVRLELTPAQMTLVGTVVPQELRALAGDGEGGRS